MSRRRGGRGKGRGRRRYGFSYQLLLALVAFGAIAGLGGFDGLVDREALTAASEAGASATEAVATASGLHIDEGDGTSGRFGLCHEGGGFNCVVDGDTIWLEGQNIRIAGIDTPETHEFGCAEEKALGDQATKRLQSLLNSGAVSLSSIDRDEDTYGRKLRNVAVDGRDVGETLIAESLARPYAGGRRSWCT